MFRLSTCVVGVLRSVGHQLSLRGISAVAVTTRNSTTEATQLLQGEWDNARPYKDIPGPKPLPFIGNFWRFLPYIGDLPSELPELYEYVHKKFGTIAKLGRLIVRHDFVMLFDPEEIEKVYRNEGPWPQRDPFEILQYYRTVLRKDIFENVGGLLVNQGEEWYKFRSKVNPIMMQPKSVQLYISPMDTVATKFIKRIISLRDEKQEMPEDFKNELFKWALESAVYIVLDTRLGCLDGDLKPDSEPQRLIDAVQVLQDSLYETEVQLSFWKIFSTPALRKFVRVSDQFTEVALKYINQAAERLKNMPKDTDRELTVLEKILAKDPDPKTAMVMALDTMFAAIDTTAFSIAALLYHLAKNPDKQQKLFEEIQRYLPEKDQPITSDILNELKYLRACIKESMRLKAVVNGNIRILSKDMVLSNYKVPKGTSVIMANTLLCKQEKYFSHATEYIPERWIKASEGQIPESKKIHPFLSLPFGFGPRMCVGRRFAELEIETLVARIIRHFRVEYNYGEIKYATKLLYAPVSPLKFKFMDRD